MPTTRGSSALSSIGKHWARPGLSNLRHACQKWHVAFTAVDCVWNVMAHAQKPDFVFRRNGRVHLNRQGASVQLTTGSRGVRISGSNVGYTMFRGCVKSTGFPLHSIVSPSLPLPCVTVCHHISTGLYQLFLLIFLDRLSILWGISKSINMCIYTHIWRRRDGIWITVVTK